EPLAFDRALEPHHALAHEAHETVVSRELEGFDRVDVQVRDHQQMSRREWITIEHHVRVLASIDDETLLRALFAVTLDTSEDATLASVLGREDVLHPPRSPERSFH